jgi:hypothetical protein
MIQDCPSRIIRFGSTKRSDYRAGERAGHAARDEVHVAHASG